MFRRYVLKATKIITLTSIALALVWMTSCKEETINTSLLSNPDNPVVKIETNMGDIFIELYEEKAPKTVENLIR